MLRVLWLQESLDELAAIWLDADSEARVQITQATELVDAELRSNPYRLSESRDEGVRVLFVHPLGVEFEVDTQQQTVWVLHVWRFRRRAT
jgi:hypothetical protein